MKTIVNINLSPGTSNRDHGEEVAKQLIKILYEESLSLKGKRIESILVNCKISAEPSPTMSYLDEIIGRLKKSSFLNFVRFVIDDQRTIDKIRSISQNRQLEIFICLNGEETALEPSAQQTIVEPEVIYEDL